MWYSVPEYKLVDLLFSNSYSYEAGPRQGNTYRYTAQPRSFPCTKTMAWTRRWPGKILCGLLWQLCYYFTAFSVRKITAITFTHSLEYTGQIVWFIMLPVSSTVQTQPWQYVEPEGVAPFMENWTAYSPLRYRCCIITCLFRKSTWLIMIANTLV